MRKGVAIIVAAGCLISPAAALADKEIVAAAPDTYTTPNVTMDQGEPLTFRNTDSLKKHDVRSEDVVDGAEIFKSDFIGQGTSFVEGSQYLTAGTYKFYCVAHTSMRGTLTVTANGTPAPRPPKPGAGGGGGGTTTGDTTPPAVTLGVGLLQASKLKSARKMTVKLGSDEAGEVKISVRYKSKTIARLSASIEKGESRRFTIKLGKSARAVLKKGRKLEIAGTVTDAAGNAGVSRTSAPLR